MAESAGSQYPLLAVDDPETIDEICRFRAVVWMATAGTDAAAFPSGQWRDPIDDVAQHWICRDSDGSLLAAARLAICASVRQMIEPHQYERFGLVADGPVAAPDRVVVSPAAQGQGLASRLLDVQHTTAIQAGAVCALRQASPRMARLLVRRGWTLHGPAGIDRRFPQVPFTVASYTFDPERFRAGPILEGTAVA